MINLLAQQLQHDLFLADGSRWAIAARDDEAASVVAHLSHAMQLHVISPSVSRPPPTLRPGKTGTGDPPHHGKLCRLLVQVGAQASRADCYVPLASDDDGVVVCILSPGDRWGGPYVGLVRLSLIVARKAQTRGGVLLHGALAEKDGLGVILAAPGGKGKTTASNRLPAPWCSLCDDTTMVVRDAQGTYWAHPWPTWSRFLDGGPGGTWDVHHAVPLKGIFFLAQAGDDRVDSVGPGRAASLLVECAEQTSQLMTRGLSRDDTSALHLERFDNLCALARVVPTHVLHISLTGAFWQEIEQTLEGGHREGPRVTADHHRSPSPERSQLPDRYIQ